MPHKYTLSQIGVKLLLRRTKFSKRGVCRLWRTQLGGGGGLVGPPSICRGVPWPSLSVTLSRNGSLSKKCSIIWMFDSARIECTLFWPTIRPQPPLQDPPPKWWLQIGTMSGSPQSDAFPLQRLMPKPHAALSQLSQSWRRVARFEVILPGWESQGSNLILNLNSNLNLNKIKYLLV